MPFAQALAQSDQFTIDLTIISGDAAPPSIPQNVSATPVAISQIDLTWDDATDDVAVVGYQVFRDGSQVATTAVSNFSDTGLTENTEFTYTIVAFDAVPNFSTSSDSVSATTLALDNGNGGGGGRIIATEGGNIESDSRVFLETITIEPEETSVVIKWRTTEPTKSVLRWGETRSYEIGSLAEVLFSTEHETRITGLTPATTYEFMIEATDGAGNTVVLTVNAFSTLRLPDTSAPSNVSRFETEVAEDTVNLEWTNPTDIDFSYVRVVANPYFYPVHEADGEVIYEGRDIAFKEEGLLEGVRYYTVFTYDFSGNISSGAIRKVVIGNPVITDDVEVSDVPTVTMPFSTLHFFQSDAEISTLGSQVEIGPYEPLRMALRYEDVPEELKTIVVMLQHPENPAETFSFLLRVDDKKEWYEANIAPFLNTGTYPVTLSVLNVKQTEVSTLAGSILVREELDQNEDEENSFIPVVAIREYLLFPFLTFISVGILILFLKIRRRLI